MRFTRFDTHAKLHVHAGADIERAKKLLEKAEATCLVANSLIERAPSHRGSDRAVARASPTYHER